MDVNIALNAIIRPTLDLMGWKYTGRRAEVLLIAIALQESRFKHRVQIRGPARSYFQFEAGGGVRGVLSHHASRDKAREMCALLDYNPIQSEVHEAMAHNDMLATAFARLLLWTDRNALPNVDDSKGAWEYYLRNWRPGKPHPDSWRGMHDEARVYVGV